MQKVRSFSFVMVLVFVVTVLLSACGGKDTTTQSSTSSSASTLSEAPKVHNLKVLGVESAPPFKWSEREQYTSWKVLQKMLDDAGLKITWEAVSGDQYAVVLQTKLASGNDLPDIAKVYTLENSAVLSLAKQGLILPLDEAIEKYSNGNIKKMYNETYKAARPLTTAPDGKLYWFSNLHLISYKGQGPADTAVTVLYRKDWMDKLKLTEPTNLNEFTDLLRQFREKDANGNGKADEILSIPLNIFSNGIAQWFGLGTSLITVDPNNKKVVSPWKQDGVKDYFRYIQGLVKEGIIDASIVGNNEMGTQRMAENKISALFDYATAPWLEPQVEKADPNVFYAPLKPLKALDSVNPFGVFEPGNLVWEKYAITSACKDLEGAIKLFDVVYTEKYSTLSTWGIEGTNFEIKDGFITPFGKTADELAASKTAEGNCLWSGILPRVQLIAMESQLAGKDPIKVKGSTDVIGYKDKYPNFSSNYLAMPTDEESAKINELQTNVETYGGELATKLALGQLSLDKWDEYMSKLDKLGLNTLIEITQARYDRYLAAMPK